MSGTAPTKAAPRPGQSRIETASNLRTAEILLRLETKSLGQICFAWTQFAISRGWFVPGIVTGQPLNTPIELYYGLYDDLLNAMRPAPSHYISSKGVPLFYREHWEAFHPGNSAAPASALIGYKWDNIAAEDLLTMSHVVPLSSFTNNELGDWNPLVASNGTYTLNAAAIPPHQNCKQAVQQFFSNCLAMGCPPWKGGPTIFLRDTSAFAFRMNSDPAVLDSNQFVLPGYGPAIMAHEVPIVHKFLAAYQLVKTDGDYPRDRYPRDTTRTQCGPGAMAGHRLVRNYTGWDGIKDELHFVHVDVNSLETSFITLNNGVEIKRLESTEQRQETRVHQTGDYAAFKHLIYLAYMQQVLSTSAVVCDIIPLGANKFRYGTACAKMTARALERLYLPKLIMENMRMTHFCSVPVYGTDVNGQPTKTLLRNDIYYPVPIWNDEANTLDLDAYNIWSWTENDILGTSYPTPGYALNFDNAVGNPYKDYIENFKIEMNKFSEYHEVLSLAVHSEKGGANLLLMTQSNPVVFTKSENGMVCIPVETAVNNGSLSYLDQSILRHLRTLIDHRDRAVASPSIFEQYMSQERRDSLKDKRNNPAKVKRAVPLTLGINTVIPFNGKFDVFKQLVLPRINVAINGNTNNIAAAVTQYGLRDTSRVDSASTVPALELMNSLYQNVTTRGAKLSSSTELMKVIRNRSTLGMGSERANPPDKAWSKQGVVGNYLGGNLGTVADLAIDRVPFLGDINNFGGWIMSLMDPAKVAARQRKRQQRRAARKEKKASVTAAQIPKAKQMKTATAPKPKKR